MSEKTPARERPLLFAEYPALEGALPWMPLATLPTPVRPLEHLQASTGCANLWFKHDEESSPLYGGNKVRKFEFIIADALAKGRTTLMTMGGIGSNQTVATAIFADHLGLRSISAMSDQAVTPIVRENLLLDLAFNSEIVYAHGYAGLVLRMIWQYVKRKGVYFIWPGGSSPLGTLGFVNAAFELRAQVERGEMPEPAHLFVALGSLGTAAGLALGLELAGLETRVHAVQVTDPLFANPKALRKKAHKTWKLLRKHAPGQVPSTVRLDNVEFHDAQFGGEYGVPTAACLEAVCRIREEEGLRLDHTYTGKALAGMLAFLEQHPGTGEPVLFWNTLNTRNFADLFARTDYHDLPEKLHRVFECDLPDFDLPDAYSQYCADLDFQNR